MGIRNVESYIPCSITTYVICMSLKLNHIISLNKLTLMDTQLHYAHKNYTYILYTCSIYISHQYIVLYCHSITYISYIES